MTLATAPFYWLTCDAPGCSQREPSADGEVIAWGDADTARESAMDSEWKLDRMGATDYCPDHALFVCERCDRLDLTPLPGERDYLCVEHSRTAEEGSA